MGKRSKQKGLRGGGLPAGAAKEAGWFGSFIQRPYISVLIIVVVGFLVYSNTFSSPFAFDDESGIYKNVAIRGIGNVAKDPIGEILFNPRIVGQMSFALNHAMHGLHVTGYHIVNLLIHLISALLVYRLVVLTFRMSYFPGYFQESPEGSFDVPRFVALFTALLFVSHPVQTQAVTYIVQRYASLAALFYLLSLVMYIQSRLYGSSRAGYGLYALSVISAVLAMKTKQIAFTLPAIIVLYEFMFFQGNIRKRLLYLIPLVLTMAIVPVSMIGERGMLVDHGTIDKVFEGASLNVITRGEYLNTQFRVIVTYIRLLFLPINQNLDYDYPVYKTFFTLPVLMSFLFLLSIFVFGVYLVYRSSREKKGGVCWYRLTAFGIFWFFITLSVESSVIPIADVIFEHRLYLPSVGFFLAIMSGIVWIRGRYGKSMPVIRRAVTPLMIIVVIALSATAYARNMVWQNEVTLWEDTVKKNPGKPRPIYNYHDSLGRAYLKDHRFDEALGEFQAAININPNFADAHSNLGLAYMHKGMLGEAFGAMQEALAMEPYAAYIHDSIGQVYVAQGKTEEAVRTFRKALELDPDYSEARRNLEGLQKMMQEKK